MYNGNNWILEKNQKQMEIHSQNQTQIDLSKNIFSKSLFFSNSAHHQHKFLYIIYYICLLF